MGLRREEHDAVVEPELDHEVMETVRLGRARGAARSADHDERGAAIVERGQRADGDVDALERLDPTDEQQQRPVFEPEAFTQPRTFAATRTEHRMVDAGWHDLDARRLRAIELRELQTFLRSRSEHQIGAVDDLVLEPSAVLGLVVETGFGLDARERVERRDERAVERVFEPVTDRARDPVVGVKNVVVVAGLAHPVEYRVGERIDQRRQVVQCHRSARSDVDVHDAKPVFDARDGWRTGIFASREHVAFDTRVRESGREGADVDVHSPTVAGTRLREREV